MIYQPLLIVFHLSHLCQQLVIVPSDVGIAIPNSLGSLSLSHPPTRGAENAPQRLVCERMGGGKTERPCFIKHLIRERKIPLATSMEEGKKEKDKQEKENEKTRKKTERGPRALHFLHHKYNTPHHRRRSFAANCSSVLKTSQAYDIQILQRQDQKQTTCNNVQGQLIPSRTKPKDERKCREISY